MDEIHDSITLRPIVNQVGIIDIRGNLTTAAESAFMDAYTRATGGGARVILLGFDHLMYMNSAGIGLLVRLVIRAQRANQQLLAFGLKEHYRRIFELTRLKEVIRVFGSEAEALENLMTAGQD